MKLFRFLFPSNDGTHQTNSMKYLIAGLGNIGEEYENTRHNIGFAALDSLAVKKQAVFQPGRYAHTAEFTFKGKTFLLIKPTTYMNVSGKAVKYWMQKEHIPQSNLLVITDDKNLPLGKLRIRKSGSDGGHNGLKNISEVLNSQNYARLRFGIGNNFTEGRQVDFVLGEWSNEEKKIVAEKIPHLTDAILSFVMEGVDRAMNKFN
jgi:PTH1 family peptidyl-tRNA hydrolase